MSGVVALGRIAGIRLQASYSWIPILALTVAALATSWFPMADSSAGAATYIGLGVIGALLLVFSVGVHELAHVAVARYLALRDALHDRPPAPDDAAESGFWRDWVVGYFRRSPAIGRVTLYPFGGVPDRDTTLRDASEAFQLAAAGPLASFILAGVATSLQSAFLGQNDLAAALFGYLNAANVLLGLFNLLPAFPLDGGRVLRSLIMRATDDAKKAATWSLVVAQVIAYLLLLWGIVLFFTAGPGSAGAALWLAVLGGILLSAARSESRGALLDALVRGVRVADAMQPAPAAIPASATLQQMVDEHVLANGTRWAPVIRAGRFAGLIALADVLRVPRDQWSQTTVGTAMTPLERLAVVSPEQTMSQACALLAARGVSQLPVVRDGAVVGVLGRDAVTSCLEHGAAPAVLTVRAAQTVDLKP